MEGIYVDRPLDKASSVVISDAGLRIDSTLSKSASLSVVLKSEVEYIVPDGLTFQGRYVGGVDAALLLRDSAHAFIRIEMKGHGETFTIDSKCRILIPSESKKKVLYIYIHIYIYVYICIYIIICVYI